MIPRAQVIVIAAAVLPWSAPAVANETETLAMRRVRLTTVASAAQGCTRLGSVSDDSVKDLRRKIVRVGGDMAVVSFGVEDMSTIYADVFRCPPSANMPAAPSVPANIPPPPPGAPPPPPPGVSR